MKEDYLHPRPWRQIWDVVMGVRYSCQGECSTVWSEFYCIITIMVFPACPLDDGFDAFYETSTNVFVFT